MVRMPREGDTVLVGTYDRHGQFRECRATVATTCDASDPHRTIDVVRHFAFEDVPERGVTYCGSRPLEAKGWCWPD